MTRFWIQLLSRLSLGSTVIVLLAIGLGTILPSEPELLFTASITLGDLEVYRMSLTRRIIVNVTHNPANDFLPDWSPDGQNIAFVSDREGFYNLYVSDAQGHNTRRLINTDANHYSPIWSPDSQKIAYIEEEGGYGGVFLYDLATGTTQTLTDTFHTHVDPTWSPDGKSITFVSDLDERYNTKIYSVDIMSHVITPIMVGSALSPVWSPDGRYLLYFAGYEKVNLFIWDNTLQKSDLLYDGDFISNDTPAWSPDGKSIIYAALTTNGNSGIFQLSVDECLAKSAACAPHELTTTPAFYRNPHWKPTHP